MKKTLFFGWLLIPALIVSGQISLKDKPSKGEWRFNPEKIWEISKAGDDDFGRIAELLVTDDHHVCLRDFGKNISYLFDENGHFLKKFAPQGKEDGQLSFYLNRFRAGGKIVLAAPDKLHFFSQDGVFERAVGNNLFLRFPLYFISENEFIYAPTLPQSPVNEKKLMVFDIGTGKERLLADFSGTETKGGPAFQGSMIMIPSLTPQVRLACDRDRMVFGRNDQYEVFVADRAGTVLSSFRLERKKLTVSPDDKRRQVADLRMPEDQKEKIVAQLPDEMTCFSHLDFLGGWIYVFAISGMRPQAGSQRIDIFSDKGEYVYRGEIEFGDRLEFASFANLVLKDGYAYVILENDQGRRTLAKYRIKLPK